VRIAVFDYAVVEATSVGKCTLAMIRGLAPQHEFTVFSVALADDVRDRVTWVRVPAIRRPGLLLFLTYRLLATCLFWLRRLTARERFDVVLATDGIVGLADVDYVHMCTRAYRRLPDRPTPPGRIRVIGQALTFAVRELNERVTFPRGRLIIVPSHGLADDLRTNYPNLDVPVVVIPNPVDVARFVRPPGTDRRTLRAQLGLPVATRLALFIGLGHFERKGLPEFLDAMATYVGEGADLALVVVGGSPERIAEYRARVREAGLGDRVTFAGHQDDVRPFLWSADLFVLPSHYETFSLVTHEAAAAGLPLLVTRAHGPRELMAKGSLGWGVDATARSILDALRSFGSLSADDIAEMSTRTVEAVRDYDEPMFVAAFGKTLDELQAGRTVE